METTNATTLSPDNQFGRLMEFLEHLKHTEGISTYAFERKCGLSRGYINTRRSKDKSGDKKLLASTIEKISDAYPDLNMQWLITGSGDMLRSKRFSASSQSSQSSYSPIQVSSPLIGRPYFNESATGNFLDVFDGHGKPVSYISMEPFNKEGFYWCNLVGDSMAPTIKSGSTICLQYLERGLDDVIFGDIYMFVIGEEGDLSFKRTVKRAARASDNDHVRLIAENKDYGYQDFPKSQVRKVFKVVFAGMVL